MVEYCNESTKGFNVELHLFNHNKIVMTLCHSLFKIVSLVTWSEYADTEVMTSLSCHVDHSTRIENLQAEQPFQTRSQTPSQTHRVFRLAPLLTLLRRVKPIHPFGSPSSEMLKGHRSPR